MRLEEQIKAMIHLYIHYVQEKNFRFKDTILKLKDKKYAMKKKKMEVEVCMYIYMTKQIMVIFAKNKGHFITIKDSN